MEPKPFSMIPSIAGRTYFGIANYWTASLIADDIATHISQMDTQIPLYYDFDGSVKQNGIGLTGSSDLTIGLDTSRRTITPIGGGFGSQLAYQYPVLFYKGVAIPEEHFDNVNTSTGVVMLTIAQTTALYTSTDPDDYEGYYMDFLPAILTNVDIPSISMPIDSSGFAGIGVEENVYTVTERADVESSGSITFQMSQTAWGPKGAVAQNQAGAEVFKRCYVGDFTIDTAWDNRQLILNQNSDKAQGIALIILEHSGKKYDSAAGHVWGKVTTVPSAMITSLNGIENLANDATDPILMTMDFTVRYPSLVAQNVIRTVGP